MDDKWDVLVDGAWLHFQRSWTGFRVYSLRFVSTPNGWTIGEAVVTGDHRKYKANPPQTETLMIDWLVNGVLLDDWETKPSPFLNSELPRPTPSRCIWVEPGWLLAGVYLGDINLVGARAKLDRLRSIEITHIIDLTVPKERGSNGQRLTPYADDARVRGFSLRSVPMSSTGIPGVTLLHDALDEIDQALGAGRPTYIHDLSGRGRSALVAGCWLLRTGQATNEEVLDRLKLPEGGTTLGLQLPDRADYRNFLVKTRDFSPAGAAPEAS